MLEIKVKKIVAKIFFAWKKKFLSPVNTSLALQNCSHIWTQVTNESVKHFHSGIFFLSSLFVYYSELQMYYRAAYVAFHAVRLFFNNVYCSFAPLSLLYATHICAYVYMVWMIEWLYVCNVYVCMHI